MQPGVVADGVYILSASAIGVVERSRVIDGSGISEGDVVLAVPSNGLHTNGYPLVRRLLDLRPNLGGHVIDGETFIDVIMRPHQCYYRATRDLFASGQLTGLAHITGGGIEENLSRILPASLDAVVDLSSVRVPEVFGAIRQAGGVPDADMLRTFNMGAGLAVVCPSSESGSVASHFSRQRHEAHPIGEIVDGTGGVNFHGAVRW